MKNQKQHHSLIKKSMEIITLISDALNKLKLLILFLRRARVNCPIWNPKLNCGCTDGGCEDRRRQRIWICKNNQPPGLYSSVSERTTRTRRTVNTCGGFNFFLLKCYLGKVWIRELNGRIQSKSKKIILNK